MKKLVIIVCIIIFSARVAFAESTPWQGIEQIFNNKGTQFGNVMKFAFPRSDLQVRVGDVKIAPGLALVSWIAFAPMGQNVVIMGDLVLAESEVSPVVSKLAADGIEITALHNHLVGESPHVLYLHFYAEGDPVALARKMKDVLGATKTPLSAPAPTKGKVASGWLTVESILGHKGTTKGNLLQVSVPRAERILENGMELPPALGVVQSLNFERFGNELAATGDFVLLGTEVNPVIKALTEHDIAVTAVHNHMFSETPRLFMLHFWGYGKPKKVAQGLRAALDNTNSQK